MWAVWLMSTALAGPELAGGVLLEDGYRPGLRGGATWVLAEGSLAKRQASHRLVGGPDVATYVIPGVRMGILGGGTVGYRRTAASGFRLEVDAGLSGVRQQYLAPTYALEDGELVEVPWAGQWRWAPTARVGIGVGPTESRSWGLVARPAVWFERPRNGVTAPVFALELATLWAL